MNGNRKQCDGQIQLIPSTSLPDAAIFNVQDGKFLTRAFGRQLA